MEYSLLAVISFLSCNLTAHSRKRSIVCMQNYERFLNGIASFVAVAVPAAVVNSGLKFMQKQIQLSFMRRLTHHLHERYCANRAYYAASVLGGTALILKRTKAPDALTVAL